MAVKSFGRIIAEQAGAVPEQLAIICGEERITWRQLDRSTNRLARAYQQLGVAAGDFVTIVLPNGIEFFEACIALWKIGATPQPVSSKIPISELTSIVGLAKSALIVGVENDIFPERNVIEADYKPDCQLSDAPLPDVTTRYWKAPTSGGSTGVPKIIVSEQKGELDIEMESAFMLSPNRVQLVAGPLYHNAPFHFSVEALLRGNQIVIMSKFDAETCLQLIDRHRVDWIFMVPTMMHRIWRLGAETRNAYSLDSLRIVLHAAASCPRQLKEDWIDWLGPGRIHELYGCTEGIGGTWISGGEWLNHPGSVGRPASSCQIKIVDEEGKECARGEVGEIYFLPETGPGSTYHYLGATANALEGGWETTGDMGYLDEEGYLYLCDRKKDMIVSGGANIYPAEVEAAIDSHPAVRSSIVVGLPDDDLGQKVHALVDAPQGITEVSLLEYLADKIVRYKIPRSIEFVDSPLRDDAGKARRSDLVEQAMESKKIKIQNA